MPCVATHSRVSPYGPKPESIAVCLSQSRAEKAELHVLGQGRFGPLIDWQILAAILRIGIDVLDECLPLSERRRHADHVDRHGVALANVDRRFQAILVIARLVRDDDQHHIAAWAGRAIFLILAGCLGHGREGQFDAAFVDGDIVDGLLDLFEVIGGSFMRMLISCPKATTAVNNGSLPCLVKASWPRDWMTFSSL